MPLFLPSVPEILAQLFTQDDALLTVKLLSFLRDMAKFPATVSDTETKVAEVTITETISTLINNGEDEDQLNIESVVLVAAAKYGCPNIVKAVITNAEVEISDVFIGKTKNEAQVRNNFEIVDIFNQRILHGIEEKHDIDKSCIHVTDEARDDNAVIDNSAKTMNNSPVKTNNNSEKVKPAIEPPTNTPSHQYRNALHKARKLEDDETIELLSLIDPSILFSPTHLNVSLQYASFSGDHDHVSTLLSDLRVDPRSDNNAAIQLASLNGQFKIMQLLLADARVDPSAAESFTIRLASEHGHANIVKLLLGDSRIDPASVGDAPIQWASENGHTETAKLLLLDPRVNPATDENYAIITASKYGHPETMSVLLQDMRVDLTEQQRNDVLQTAVQDGFVDVVSILLARFPVSDIRMAELVCFCAEYGHHEVLKGILLQWKPLNQEQLAITIRKALRDACKGGHHQIVLELLAQSGNSEIGKTVKKLLQGDDILLEQLPTMHVEVLRKLLTDFGSSFSECAKTTLLSSTCLGSVCVVRELLDNHQDKFGDWKLEHFNGAALYGNVPVLRLLSLSRYGGIKKLSENPPLNRICTRRVLGEICIESSIMLMWCIKKIKTPRVMAKLLDVLRDLITGGLLRYTMK